MLKEKIERMMKYSIFLSYALTLFLLERRVLSASTAAEIMLLTVILQTGYLQKGEMIEGKVEMKCLIKLCWKTNEVLLRCLWFWSCLGICHLRVVKWNSSQDFWEGRNRQALEKVGVNLLPLPAKAYTQENY